jgi:hypothetical protein
MCKSNSGYCLFFKIYVRDNVKDSSLRANTNVVFTMCEPLLDISHPLNFDNWYSSPDLYIQLTERKINVIGTVKPNRRDMPQDISKTKLKRGDHEIWSGKNILCVKWKDNKDVHFLSMKHKSADITHTCKLKRKRGQTPRKEVEKPECALEYQKGMGGVDLQDQVTAVSYFSIFWVCAFSAPSLCITKSLGGTGYTDFKTNIGQQLLESMTLPEYSAWG